MATEGDGGSIAIQRGREAATPREGRPPACMHTARCPCSFRDAHLKVRQAASSHRGSEHRQQKGKGTADGRRATEGPRPLAPPSRASPPLVVLFLVVSMRGVGRGRAHAARPAAASVAAAYHRRNKRTAAAQLSPNPRPRTPCHRAALYPPHSPIGWLVGWLPHRGAVCCLHTPQTHTRKPTKTPAAARVTPLQVARSRRSTPCRCPRPAPARPGPRGCAPPGPRGTRASAAALPRPCPPGACP